MNYKHLLFTIVSILTITACKSPESVSKNYSESKANGECESLILITIGDARKTMVNYECKPYDAIIVNDIGCEVGKESATCVYSEKRSYYDLDAEVETTLKLLKYDRDWKISQERKEIITITGGTKPELVCDIFIKLLSEGNCEIAKMLTVSNAKNRLTNQMENECQMFNLELISTDCKINNNSAIYRTTEKRNFGREEKYIYNLIKVGEEWRIIDFKRDLSDSPHATTRAFVTYLSDGKCREALEIAANNATETVEASLASGCEKYQSEIVGDVICKVDNNNATCSCTENRDILGEMTFNYDLEKIDGEWKVVSYVKDADGLDLGGE